MVGGRGRTFQDKMRGQGGGISSCSLNESNVTIISSLSGLFQYRMLELARRNVIFQRFECGGNVLM